MVTNTPITNDDESGTDEHLSTVDSMDRALDQWRERIDELKVQVDLASLDVLHQPLQFRTVLVLSLADRPAST